jgi:hypothetical protein
MPDEDEYTIGLCKVDAEQRPVEEERRVEERARVVRARA